MKQTGSHYSWKAYLGNTDKGTTWPLGCGETELHPHKLGAIGELTPTPGGPGGDPASPTCSPPTLHCSLAMPNQELGCWGAQ